MINDGQYCKIPVPKYCQLKSREGLFDLNRLLPKCEDIKDTIDFKILPEYFQNNVNLKTIGYPRTEHFPFEARTDFIKFGEEVNKHVIDMDDKLIPQSVKDSIEVTIDVSNKKEHKLHIDVKRNNTRAEELKKIRSEVLKQDKASNNTSRIDK
jgi:hypothetical protein